MVIRRWRERCLDFSEKSPVVVPVLLLLALLGLATTVSFVRGLFG